MVKAPRKLARSVFALWLSVCAEHRTWCKAAAKRSRFVMGELKLALVEIITNSLQDDLLSVKL